MDSGLLIVGSSVRAAAFSAIRAGLRPYAIDLFADRDLAAVCPAAAIPAGQFPAAMVNLARNAPPGPWMYTGALENHPELISEIARIRPLWGNDAGCLRRIRDPFALANALHAAGLPHPAIRQPDDPASAGRWLLKPIASGGGTGIRDAKSVPMGRTRNSARPMYLQEFIAGQSRAAIFVANSADAQLLGVTRQLVGESWAHARPFRYAGSIGPVELSSTERVAWERLGKTVSAFAGLRGLFGIDAAIRDGVPWPVEVNPRYTASVEVLEYASGLKSMYCIGERSMGRAHRLGWRHGPLEVMPRPITGGCAPAPGTLSARAVWFAPQALTFPADGPWTVALHAPSGF